MRKGTLFLSAVLTTFMLAVLVTTASAYQNLVKTRQRLGQHVQAAPAETSSTSVPTDAPILQPVQAAALAAQVIGRTDAYSVESAQFNGASAYMVTFSSGDVVYVSPQGQILSVTKLAQNTLIASASSGGGSPASSRQSGTGGSGGEHEQEHEDSHDD